MEDNKTKKNYKVIGDIHGRQTWKQLVSDDAVNVFLGDYFDPYSDISNDALIDNFYGILDYKTKHPETILLYGNHDFHYLFPEYGGSTSRYNWKMAKTFKEIFDESHDQFHGIIYCPVSEDGLTRYLISHAGVTRNWFFRWFDSDDIPSLSLTDDGGKLPQPKWLEQSVNRLWAETDGREFSFRHNCDPMDTYGTSPQQSPIWVRPETLIGHNLYKDTDIIQVVGHTQMYHVQDFSKGYGCVFTDCLGQATECFEFNF